MNVALDLLINLAVLLLLLGVTSLSASWSLLRGLSPRGVVLAGSVTLAVFFAGVYFMIQSSSKQEAVPTFQLYFDEAWTHVAQGLTSKGVPADKVSLVKVFYDKYFVKAFPGWIAVSSLIMGLLAYYLASAVLSRLSTKVTKPIAFREWLIPEPLVFGLIIGAIFKLVFKENSPLDIAGNNLLVFFVGLYTLGGLSIVSFFFHKWNLPGAIRIVSYFVLLNLIFETICFFGVLDVWFDFRKIKSAPAEPTPTT